MRSVITKSIYIAGVLTLLMCSTVFADDTSDTLTGSSSDTSSSTVKQIAVTNNLPSVFSLIIPKRIDLGEEEVIKVPIIVTGELASGKAVKCNLPGSIEMEEISGLKSTRGVIEVSSNQLEFDRYDLSNGSCKKSVTLSKDPGSMQAGDYVGTLPITVSIENASQAMTVFYDAEEGVDNLSDNYKTYGKFTSGSIVSNGAYQISATTGSNTKLCYSKPLLVVDDTVTVNIEGRRVSSVGYNQIWVQFYTDTSCSKQIFYKQYDYAQGDNIDIQCVADLSNYKGQNVYVAIEWIASTIEISKWNATNVKAVS